MAKKLNPQDCHRFIDEAGDMTFYTKRRGIRISSIGNEGVSTCFMIGMVHVKEDLESARSKIRQFSKDIEANEFFCSFPSVMKSIERGRHGFYPHAKNDPAELRYEFFKLMLDDIDFSIQVVVGRKVPRLFESQHHYNEGEFYADLLSHLLKDKASIKDLVIDVAERGSSTSNVNLQHAFEIAQERSLKSVRNNELSDGVRFNVQPYDEDPLLSLVDYGLWAVQRVYERGDEKFYKLMRNKIVLVVDLYDANRYSGWRNYYSPKSNPLTREAIGYKREEKK